MTGQRYTNEFIVSIQTLISEKTKGEGETKGIFVFNETAKLYVFHPWSALKNTQLKRIKLALKNNWEAVKIDEIKHGESGKETTALRLNILPDYSLQFEFKENGSLLAPLKEYRGPRLGSKDKERR